MADASPTEPRQRSEFYRHLLAFGGMSRSNPELIRLAGEVPCSVDHLFKVATGKKEPSTLLVHALVRLTPLNKSLTVESFE
jgi:hypothetical protein